MYLFFVFILDFHISIFLDLFYRFVIFVQHLGGCIDLTTPITMNQEIFQWLQSSKEWSFISLMPFRHSHMLSWKSPGDSNFDPHLLVTQNLVSILWPLPACSPTEISQEVAANTPRQRIATRIFTDLSLNFSTQENFNNIQPLSNFAYLIFVTTGGCVTFFS